MKELLDYIVTKIVEKPEEVKITETEDETGTVILNLSVAEEDMGKVIGKEGKIIKSIRTIIRILAIKNGKRVIVNLEDKNPRVSQTDLPVPQE